MAIIAYKCKGIKINVVDVNQERINAWNNDDLSKLPIYEPGLAKIISETRNINLFFSTKVKESIEIADMVFISVNTPTKLNGLGAGKASDLKWVEASARKVAEYSKGHTIVVEKSKLPVRTAEVIKTILKESYSYSSKNSDIKSFDVLSNPEFMAEGSAIDDLENPDRILIGGENEESIKLLNDIYSNWVPTEKILHTNLWSSELAKLTANAFLAQRISSINSISALCEETGADIREVSRAIGSDHRIGSKFLDSGPGFGGSCFKKDILNLVYLSEYFGLKEVANFWEGVVNLNNWHQKRISQLIVKKLFGTITGKKIVILGFAFKANTNDTRESAAISICKSLIEEGAYLNIHDPKVDLERIEEDLGLKSIKSEKNCVSSSRDGNWSFATDIYSAFYKADAILIITEWDLYKSIDWDKTSKLMNHPGWVFDARSISKKEKILQSGLKFWRIGDGEITSKK